jgi:hypothetical protein
VTRFRLDPCLSFDVGFCCDLFTSSRCCFFPGSSIFNLILSFLLRASRGVDRFPFRLSSVFILCCFYCRPFLFFCVFVYLLWLSLICFSSITLFSHSCCLSVNLARLAWYFLFSFCYLCFVACFESVQVTLSSLSCLLPSCCPCSLFFYSVSLSDFVSVHFVFLSSRPCALLCYSFSYSFLCVAL